MTLDMAIAHSDRHLTGVIEIFLIPSRPLIKAYKYLKLYNSIAYVSIVLVLPVTEVHT